MRPEDKVLLVGDVKQHEAVEAGSPFAQLQRHGLETARLDEIVRQEDAPLREVVEHLSIGKIKEAVDRLREQGRVTEIADPDERLKAIAKDYCRQPESTLVISPANKERVELNRLIHQQLQKDGQVFSKNYKTKVLENRNDMSGAERTFAARYQPDDVIRYTTGSKKHGISAGEYARVLSTDDKANEITVRLDKSQKEITYNPQRLQGVSVYREAEREFSERDRLQFRAPYHPQRIANGELGTLEKIEKGRLTVKLDSGRSVSFPVEKNRHIDHGYAVTSYSSQGQTVNRVLVHADTSEPDKLLNRRMAYVAASRARQDAHVYTDSDERLSAALARQVDKSTALEASRESHETKARNLSRLELIETPAPLPQFEHWDELPAATERPAALSAGTPRPPAQRVPQPTAPPARAGREQLPIPDRPPARPYVVTTPVDQNRPAAELSAELVRLADANRLEQTGRGITAPVQRFMLDHLMKSAGRPPSEAQQERLAATAQALGLSEPPKLETSLQAALWSARNAPDRVERLERITQVTERLYAQQVQAERPAATERPPAQRAVRTGPSRQPDEPSPFDKELRQFAVEIAGQLQGLESLSATITAKTEMSAEIVKLANDNRLAATGQEIAPPVQKFMEQIFMQAADRPPTPQQVENLALTSKALGLGEPPQMSTSLQSSLWMAHNAPDRAERLEQLTQSAEVIYANQSQQLQQTETIEPTPPPQDFGMSID